MQSCPTETETDAAEKRAKIIEALRLQRGGRTQAQLKAGARKAAAQTRNVPSNIVSHMQSAAKDPVVLNIDQHLQETAAEADGEKKNRFAQKALPQTHERVQKAKGYIVDRENDGFLTWTAGSFHSRAKFGYKFQFPKPLPSTEALLRQHNSLVEYTLEFKKNPHKTFSFATRAEFVTEKTAKNPRPMWDLHTLCNDWLGKDSVHEAVTKMAKRYGKQIVEENIFNGKSQVTGDERQFVTAQGITLLNPNITVSDTDTVRLRVYRLQCPDDDKMTSWVNGFSVFAQ